MYEIRIYNERYNVMPHYYTGDEDIKFIVRCKSKETLIEAWESLLEAQEGETYSVWDGKNVITGGAYDPGDIDWIREYFKRTKKGGKKK